MHEVHYLTLAAIASRRGWIAPVELPHDNQQAAVYVVPVDETGRLFNRYRLEFAKYTGSGNYQTRAALLNLDTAGVLTTEIEGQSLLFRQRTVNGNPVIFEYIGSLTHADFRFALAEIEPVSENMLAELYSKHSLVPVGCDPESEYGGTESILASDSNKS